MAKKKKKDITWFVGHLTGLSHVDQLPQELHPLPHLPSPTQVNRSPLSCSSSASLLAVVTWQLLIGWPGGGQAGSPL
jgi:hypothetical protein